MDQFCNAGISACRRIGLLPIVGCTLFHMSLRPKAAQSQRNVEFNILFQESIFERKCGLDNPLFYDPNGLPLRSSVSVPKWF